MPRPRFARADPAKRKALLDAAVSEFATHGYAGASINRILVAAGLSKGAFYYYFDDKADLAATVLARESEHWFETLDALPLANTPEEFWAEMERLNERGAAELRESPQRGDLMIRLGTAAGRDPALLERLTPFMSRARERLLAFYQRGQEVGAVRSDLEVQTLMVILQGTKQAVSQALLPADRAPTPEEIVLFLRVNMDCLRRISAVTAGAPAPSQPKEEA